MPRRATAAHAPLLTLTTPSASHSTKTALAIHALREAILTGDLRAGEEFTVGQVAAQLAMSPTPVREAIRTLQASGLVVHLPHHTFTVTNYSAHDIEEIFMLRGVLEAMATRLATPRLQDDDLARLDACMAAMHEAITQGNSTRMHQLNAEWHLEIYKVSHSTVLLEVILGLWQKFLWQSVWSLPGHGEQSLDRHEEIMDALRERDAERAATLMERHIRAGATSVLAFQRLRHPDAHPSSVVPDPGE